MKEHRRAEIETQRSLDHPNIVKIHESFEDSERRRIHIVMELCTGGSLVSRMKEHRYGYGERAAAVLVEKMLSAVLYCHRHGIVHRDIKLDNFIYETEKEDAELKLIDFGFAFEVRPGGKDEMYERLGTLSYMAPELLGPDKKLAYDSSVDMWAMGAVTYMLLCGRRPFDHKDRTTKKRMIRKDPVRFDGHEWERVSAEAKDFILQLMQKDPSKRLAASDALKHDWIKKAAQGPTADPRRRPSVERRIVENLESYSRATELKRLALEAIAFSTPPSKLEELRRLFGEIDVDGSGTLSLDEFRKAMVHQLPEDKVDRIFRAMDLSRGGEVDYTEFLSAALNQKRNLKSPSISGAFSLLDTDHDGYITARDLSALLGESLSKEEVASMLASPSVGARGGKLAYEEFKFLMLRGNDGVSERVRRQALLSAKKRQWKSFPAKLDRHVPQTLVDPPAEMIITRRSETHPAPGGFDFHDSSDSDEQSAPSSEPASAETAAPEPDKAAATERAAGTEKAAAFAAATERAEAAEQAAAEEYRSTLEAIRVRAARRHQEVEAATITSAAALAAVGKAADLQPAAAPAKGPHSIVYLLGKGLLRRASSWRISRDSRRCDIVCGGRASKAQPESRRV